MSANNHIITTRTGDGPIMAIDLRTLPQEVMLSIINAAIGVSTMFAGGGMAELPDDGPAEEALVELMATTNAIAPSMKQTAPGINAISSTELLQSYPVIRHGDEVIVPVSEMTDLEIEATIRRIRSEEFPGRFNLRRIDWKLTLRHLPALGQSTHPAQP